MSQEYTNNRRQRRATRSQRNRPVLVTSSSNQVDVEREDEQAVATAAPIVAEPELLVVPTPIPAERKSRKLPGFFSNVRKSEQDEARTETDIAQARLARATRSKTATETTKTAAARETSSGTEGKTTTATSTARPATNRATNAPPRLFKTRYIIGMGIYLLFAEFVGTYELRFLQSAHLDNLITSFGVFQIRTSTILYLATLIIVLVLLARFDLIPRSFSAAKTSQQGRSGQRSSQNGADSGEKAPLPTMRQGVKGTDDRLYQEYRANQRRDKRR